MMNNRKIAIAKHNAEQETLCGYIHRVPSTRHVEANTEENKDL